jgi:kinesin family protein 4/21/27
LKFLLFDSSSGITLSGTSNISQSLPAGEIQLNDVALNHYGTVLYSAAGDRVRVWDLRK